MGMAASQARYIELEARKTNVEYEGQQINQQRTALANESAGLFNKMLELQVPTAPNYEDFTTTVYNFTDGTKDYTIDTIAKYEDPNGEYNAKVNYYSNSQEYTGMYKERSDLEFDKIGNNWYYGTYKLEPYDAKIDEAAVKQISLDAVNNPDLKTSSFVGQNYLKSIDPNATPQERQAALGQIYKYSTGGVTYFLSLDQVRATTKDKLDDQGQRIPVMDPATGQQAVDGNGNPVWEQEAIYSTSEPVQNNYATTITQKTWDSALAYIKKDDSGNFTEITLENYSNTFDLAVSEKTDDRAYNQAMNNYVYEKSVYDKTIADLNAKTEIIHQEDRTLELKLRQLDTEHLAMQTEMEAVKKVLEKNIEDTFKTFG